MALLAKVLTVDCPASTGNQAYTGVGFQPQALILFCTTRTTDGTSPGARIGLGVATSSSARFAWGINSDDNVGTTVVQRAVSNALCVRLVTNDAATTGLEADLVSLDADGFTLNWSIVTSGADVHVLALAGMSNAKAHGYALPTGTGSQATTGVGFQPVVLLELTGQVTAAAAGGGNAFGAVAATTASASGSLAAAVADGAGSASAFLRHANDRFLPLVTQLGVVSADSTLTSLDSDGFTINVSNAFDAAYLANALCLAGLQAKVGSITAPAGTGSQGYTGVGFRPKALLLFGAHAAFANATAVDALNVTIGAGTSSSARAVASMAHVDASDPTECDHDSDTTKILKVLTAGTPTVDLAADLTSFDSDGFTLNWTTVGTGASTDQFVYLALGNAAGVSDARPAQPVWVGI